MAPRKGRTQQKEQVISWPQVKERENVFGVAHIIFARFNDTFVHVTDLSLREYIQMFQVFLPFKYYQKDIGFATNCGLMICCIYLLWTLLPLSVPFFKICFVFIFIFLFARCLYLYILIKSHTLLFTQFIYICIYRRISILRFSHLTWLLSFKRQRLLTPVLWWGSCYSSL